jgi:hypothetical protein
VLKLRPGIVVEVLDRPPALEREQRVLVQLTGADRAGERREAVADVALVGRAELGDRVVVNVQALDLGLVSEALPACDVVHVNMTRGLASEAHPTSEAHPPGAHAMKLDHTSLQHAVEAVDDERLELPLENPVAVLALHRQLAAVAWAFAQAAPGRTLGYVQSDGGALPGGHSRTVALLRDRGLLAGHLTAGACFGGEGEAISTVGAIHHGSRTLGWDAVVCGPGPAVTLPGVGTSLGHGGMAALDSAHVALALGCPTLLVPRMSSGDEGPRRRGISHHTVTVLDLLLEPVTVALPAGMRSPVGNDLRASLGAAFAGRLVEPTHPTPRGLEVARPGGWARITRHDWRRAEVDLPAFAASGLPSRALGRAVIEDPLFFAAALAGGSVLAELAASCEQRERHEELESA